MEQQEQGTAQGQRERTETCCCPVCGGMHHMPWGPKARRHMMHGGMHHHPWGEPYGRYMGPMGMGFLCLGPAMMAFAIGVMVGRRAHHWKFSRCC